MYIDLVQMHKDKEIIQDLKRLVEKETDLLKSF